MESTLFKIWVYLAQTPLLWLTLTLLVYQAAIWLAQRTRLLPIVNPVLLAILLLVALLLLTGTSYQTYFTGAQFIHFLLGPATVALAIPLNQRYATLRRVLLPLLGALVVGSITSVIAAAVISRLVGVSGQTLLSTLPKSVTTPIAMSISEQVGGLPSLTAVLVILTGICGAIAAPAVLRISGVTDNPIRGFAIGVAAHGIGTARAFQLSEEAGAFAGLAMGLNGAVTAVIVPILVRLLNL